MTHHPTAANGSSLRNEDQDRNVSVAPDRSIRPLLLTIGSTLTLAMAFIAAAAARIDLSALDVGTRLVA